MRALLIQILEQLQEQKSAINRLAESNMRLIEALAEDNDVDVPGVSYLSDRFDMEAEIKRVNDSVLSGGKI